MNLRYITMTESLKTIVWAVAVIGFGMPGAAQSAPPISWEGQARPIMELTPERSTGLDRLLVAYTTDGLTLVINEYEGMRGELYAYTSRGGGFAEKVEGVTYSGNQGRLAHPAGDTGYILEYGDTRFYFWLTDYSVHRLDMTGITFPAESECGMAQVTITGTGDAIHYYSINGRRLTLSREIQLEYNTMLWNEEAVNYVVTPSLMETENVGTVYVTPAPLCDTQFTAAGDRFLEYWGEQQQVSSDTYRTRSVEVHTSATQTGLPEEGSNQIASQTEGLGGSAPANISFTAWVTDAVIHKEWQFASDAQFEDITHRFNQQDIDYEFREEGTVYVRFVGSNDDGSCTAEGDVYTVQIGSSELKCPNAFTPGASEGINDIWKVSYRSLIKFSCSIFDRYGTQLYHFTDPQDGWNGKYKGKLVKPGVYFYVIEAEGADGKRYKEAGDINILRYNSNGSVQPAE